MLKQTFYSGTLRRKRCWVYLGFSVGTCGQQVCPLSFFSHQPETVQHRYFAQTACQGRATLKGRAVNQTHTQSVWKCSKDLPTNLRVSTVILTPLWSCPPDRPRPPASRLPRSSWCCRSAGHCLHSWKPRTAPGWCEASSCSRTWAAERWCPPHAGSQTFPCHEFHYSQSRLQELLKVKIQFSNHWKYTFLIAGINYLE